jgi:hypothetical protein
MKSESYPLAVPSDLLKEVRKAAKKTGLSMADAMRQSMKLGLPKLIEDLSMTQVLKNLKPLTPEECRQCWGSPDPEFDGLAAHCASQPPVNKSDLRHQRGVVTEERRSQIIATLNRANGWIL